MKNCLASCYRGPCSFDKMNKIIKVLCLLEAALLIVIGVFRLISFLKIGSFANYVITFYLFLFAILIAATEFGVNFFRRTYYFLNFAWGKALFFIFLGSLIIAGRVHAWLEIPAAIVILVTAGLLIILSIVYKKEEREKVENTIMTLDPQIELIDRSKRQSVVH